MNDRKVVVLVEVSTFIVEVSTINSNHFFRKGQQMSINHSDRPVKSIQQPELAQKNANKC